jgi:hypothetical protein
VAFKHNLPLPVLVLALFAAALVALVLFHRPPDEDLLRQAVDAYVASLGNVKQMEQHGPVADIIAGDNNTLIYALFEKKDGTWAYSRNLAADYSAAVKDPETQKVVVHHLLERISQRFQQSAKISDDVRDFAFKYELAREVPGEELLGTCTVDFKYPKVGDAPQRGGRYVEYFEWKDGKWGSRGPGSLYDAVR